MTMGCHKNISLSDFPEQGYVGLRVSVCFHYDASKVITGTIVRDDTVEPFRTIIELDDRRYVLATECHYRPLRKDPQ